MLGLLPLFALSELFFALFTKKTVLFSANQNRVIFFMHIIKSVKSIVHVYILFGACSFCVLCFFLVFVSLFAIIL